MQSPLSPTPASAENMGFAYPSGVRAVNGLNLRVPKGRKIAVVGPSGGGKSTLLKLLCRFYCPYVGSLKLFGGESDQWEPDALRGQMAIVTQDSLLFGGSFYENLKLGKPGLSREECEGALREVRLWELVSSFPDGIDHPIGEGGMSLSGGQRQRLCIARALVKDASLVLLDEATSALDLETEREVQSALIPLLRGRTVVVIAHRLSSVMDADYTYVVEQGRVAEEGKPEALLSKRGRYWEMCRLQGLVEGEA